MLDDPAGFWQRMEEMPSIRKPDPPAAIAAIRNVWSRLAAPYRVVRRVSGEGSLGHPRFVAIAQFHGGQVALEAKEASPSACVWAANGKGSMRIHYQEVMDHAVRCPDPYVQLRDKWLVRRLAPDSAAIEIEALPKERSEERLLHAMGWEAANVHLGTKTAIEAIRRDLAQRSAGWLCSNTRAMVKATLKDWKDWKKEGV